MRCLLCVVLLLALMATAARAQLAQPSPGLACIAVTPEVKAAIAGQAFGRCASGCRGCGCYGGPGFRGPNGCVGFANINSVCGGPPHDNCKAECATVQPTCLAQGRAWLAANAAQLKLTITWIAAASSSPPKTAAANSPVLQPQPSAAPDENLEQTRLEQTSPENKPEFACGQKSLCRDMTSCAEAQFHFTQCDLPDLDGSGSGNGVPCKALCKQ